MLGKWIACSEHDQLVIYTEYSQGLRARTVRNKLWLRSFCGTMGYSIEDADAGGESGSTVLRGDAAVVRERRAAGRAHSRAREAVQAELAKLRPIEPVVSIAAEKLRRERELVAARASRRRRREKWPPTSTRGSSSSRIKASSWRTTRARRRSLNLL